MEGRPLRGVDTWEPAMEKFGERTSQEEGTTNVKAVRWDRAW